MLASVYLYYAGRREREKSALLHAQVINAREHTDIFYTNIYLTLFVCLCELITPPPSPTPISVCGWLGDNIIQQGYHATATNHLIHSVCVCVCVRACVRVCV